MAVAVRVQSASRLWRDLAQSVLAGESDLTVAGVAGPNDSGPLGEAPAHAVTVTWEPDARPVVGGDDTTSPPCAPAELVERVRRAAHGPALVGEVMPSVSRPHRSLTVRELAVLRLLASGLSTAAAASELGVSVSTVNGHKRRLFSKLGVQTSGHALAKALRDGAVSPAQLGAAGSGGASV